MTSARLCEYIVEKPLTKAVTHCGVLSGRHLSAAEGCYSVVAWLLSKGVDVNPIDRFKRTPLEVCCGVRMGAWLNLETYNHS